MLRLGPTPAAAVLVLANLFDALFTITLLELGLASEMNPLVASAYGCSPMAFVLLKLCLVRMGVLLVAGERPFSTVARGGAALYVAVMAYQVGLTVKLGWL